MTILALVFLSLADPQEIPEEESPEDDSTDEAPKEEQPKESIIKDEPIEEGDALEESHSTKQHAESDQKVEFNVDVDISGALGGLVGLVEEAEEEEEDLDISFIKGGLFYSVDFHYWITGEEDISLVTGSFFGDPQYIWEIKKNIGPTLGLRFRLRSNESTTQQASDNLIGAITGFQLGPIRLCSGASYYNHHLFNQKEISRSAKEQEIHYSYNELVQSNGLLWENSLHFAPIESDFYLDSGVAFPFQMSGDREMGAAFTDSLRAHLRIGYSTWMIGYEVNLFPNSLEHVISLGSGINL